MCCSAYLFKCARGSNVGGITRLGNVVIDPRHLTAFGAFNATSFTLSGGTGTVSFNAGTGLNSTGDISIDTNGNTIGLYEGAHGILGAGTGTITATVSFTGLDIDGAGATLSAGYIGAPGVAGQAMANLISIGGVSYPVLVGDPAYTFAGFIIGGALAPPPGGSGGGSGGGSTPSPVTLPTGPITTPPVTTPGDGPLISIPEMIFSPISDVARIQRSVQTMVQIPKLPPQPACDADSAYATCDALLESR